MGQARLRYSSTPRNSSVVDVLPCIRDRAAEHDQRVEVYSQGLKADEEPSKKKEVGREPSQRKLLRLGYWEVMEETREQHTLHQPRKRHQQKYKDDYFEKKEWRYRQGANLEKHVRCGIVPFDGSFTYR